MCLGIEIYEGHVADRPALSFQPLEPLSDRIALRLLATENEVDVLMHEGRLCTGRIGLGNDELRHFCHRPQRDLIEVARLPRSVLFDRRNLGMVARKAENRRLESRRRGCRSENEQSSSTTNRTRRKLRIGL